MSKPLVSIVCLCYNHEPFVHATLASVWAQNYDNIEVIIVDDGSQDQSVKKIREYIEQNPCPYPLHTIFLEQNIGNCAAFNRGWKLANGEFIIDLATDDVLLPDRVSLQLELFQSLPEDYGVVFSEVQYINESGEAQYLHFQDKYKHIRPIPQGDIYAKLIALYFIPSPSMMYRQRVLQDLGGYDERLAYEDYDFWIRSSRKYKYAYLNHCTTLVRKSAGSMSKAWYKKGDRQLHSTYLVCQKIKVLNKSPEEDAALIQRVKFEIRQAVFSNNQAEALLFFTLLKDIGHIDWAYRFLLLLTRSGLNLSWLRDLYLRFIS